MHINSILSKCKYEDQHAHEWYFLISIRRSACTSMVFFKCKYDWLIDWLGFNAVFNNDTCHIDFCQTSERKLAKPGFKLTTPSLKGRVVTGLFQNVNTKINCTSTVFFLNVNAKISMHINGIFFMKASRAYVMANCPSYVHACVCVRLLFASNDFSSLTTLPIRMKRHTHREHPLNVLP